MSGERFNGPRTVIARVNFNAKPGCIFRGQETMRGSGSTAWDWRVSRSSVLHLNNHVCHGYLNAVPATITCTNSPAYEQLHTMKKPVACQ